VVVPVAVPVVFPVVLPAAVPVVVPVVEVVLDVEPVLLGWFGQVPFVDPVVVPVVVPVVDVGPVPDDLPGTGWLARVVVTASRIAPRETVFHHAVVVRDMCFS
jgi:hypothetical protein